MIPELPNRELEAIIASENAVGPRLGECGDCREPCIRDYCGECAKRELGRRVNRGVKK